MGQLGAAPARLAARRAGAGTLSKRGPTKGPRLVFSSEKKIRPHDPATTKRWTVGGRGLDWVPHARCRSKRTGRVTRVAERERERGAARRGAFVWRGFPSKIDSKTPRGVQGKGTSSPSDPTAEARGDLPGDCTSSSSELGRGARTFKKPAQAESRMCRLLLARKRSRARFPVPVRTDRLRL